MKSRVKLSSSKIIIITGKIEEAHNYHDLMYIKCEGKYCRLYFSEGAEYLVFISLTRLVANTADSNHRNTSGWHVGQCIQRIALCNRYTS